MGEGRAADTGGKQPASKQPAWTDDMRRPAAGSGEGRGGSTVRGLRRATKPQSSVDGRSGRRARRRPKSSQNRAILTRISKFMV